MGCSAHRDALQKIDPPESRNFERIDAKLEMLRQDAGVFDWFRSFLAYHPNSSGEIPPIERERMRKTPTNRYPVRKLLILWMFLLSAVAFLDRTNISIAGASIQAELLIDNVHLGWIFSSFLLGYAVFQVAGGWMACRFGPRRVLTAGVLWWGVFTALTTIAGPHLAHALLLLVLIRFSLGAGEAVMYPSTNQFVSQWIPVAERGSANGWIFGGVGAGAGLSIPILTWIISHCGWRASFWFSALAGILVGLVWCFMARDQPEQHPLVSLDELKLIHATRSVAPIQPSAGRVSWQAALCNRNVAALSLSYFSFGYVAWIFFSWFFIYMAQVRGLNLKTDAFVSMIPFVAMTVCCLAGGSISDRISRRFGRRLGRCGIAVVSLALTAAFLVIGSRVQGAHAASMILAGGAGALYLSQSSFWAVSADISGDLSGVVSGVMNTSCQIGGALTASLTPYLAGRYGWRFAFIFAAVLAIGGSLLWLVVDPGPSRDDSPSETKLERDGGWINHCPPRVGRSPQNTFQLWASSSTARMNGSRLFSEQFIDYIRVHVLQASGFSPARKIAILAEQFALKPRGTAPVMFVCWRNCYLWVLDALLHATCR